MTDFDVGIVGGGPAGAAMGAYLAKAGIRCVIFESDLFPRPHVGESLVPASTRVFRELGFLEKMQEAGFPRKYGAAWTAARNAPVYQHDWDDVEDDVRIEFAERAQEGVDLPYTFHVDRGKFDLMLLQHAHELGATVYEGVRVRGVEIGDGGARVRFDIGKQGVGVNCGMVVDASGRRTLLGTQMRLKVRDPVFDQYAIHSWFGGYDRGVLARTPRQSDYIFVHFLPLSNSWVWQIPISESVTSIGVVTQKKSFAARRTDREAFFWDCLGSRPELHESVSASTRIRPFKDEGDYSYAMKAIVGDRFVLIGDAARFVDPIFSTGVSIALSSARFAAPCIVQACESGDFGRKRFEAYETTLRRGTRNWYDFISVYYRLNVLFTSFVSSPTHRRDVLKLLQGDVYDEEQPAVLRLMKETVKKVENDPAHLWHSALGTLTADAFTPLF